MCKSQFKSLPCESCASGPEKLSPKPDSPELRQCLAGESYASRHNRWIVPEGVWRVLDFVVEIEGFVFVA